MKWYKAIIFESNTNREYSSKFLPKLQEVMGLNTDKEVAFFEAFNPDQDITTWWLTEKAAKLANMYCPEWQGNYISITEYDSAPKKEGIALLVGMVESWDLLNS